MLSCKINLSAYHCSILFRYFCSRCHRDKFFFFNIIQLIFVFGLVEVWFGMIESTLVWFGKVCLDWFGKAWCDLVDFDLVWSIHRRNKKIISCA